MTNEEIRGVFYQQLTYDCSCSIDEVKSRQNVLKVKNAHSERRVFRGDDCFLKIWIVNGKLIVNCLSEDFLVHNKEYFDSSDADWFFEPDSMYQLNELLKQEGHMIDDRHHFYLPDMDWNKKQTTNNKAHCLHWYEQEEIKQFNGDDRFCEALSFLPETPDLLAVTWEEEGEILGMAGASADSKRMWQIGINVLPGGEHRGLGTLLVTQLKEELLRRGIVPFYGTVESHIRSQRVAVGSGFVPSWAELFTRRV